MASKKTFETITHLNCRKTPGGEILGVFPIATKLTKIGTDKEHEGTIWKNVKGESREGKEVSGFVMDKYVR